MKRLAFREILQALLLGIFLSLLYIPNALANESVDVFCSARLFGTMSKESCEGTCPEGIEYSCLKVYEYDDVECYSCARDQYCEDLGLIGAFACWADCEIDPDYVCVAQIVTPIGMVPVPSTFSGEQCYKCVKEGDRCSGEWRGSMWWSTCDATCPLTHDCNFVGFAHGKSCYTCDKVMQCEDIDRNTIKCINCASCADWGPFECVDAGVSKDGYACCQCVPIIDMPPPPPPPLPPPVRTCADFNVKEQPCECADDEEPVIVTIMLPDFNVLGCCRCEKKDKRCEAPKYDSMADCEADCEGECFSETVERPNVPCYYCVEQEDEVKDCRSKDLFDSCSPDPCFEGDVCYLVHRPDIGRVCANCQPGYAPPKGCADYQKMDNCAPCYKASLACRQVHVKEIDTLCAECIEPEVVSSGCTEVAVFDVVKKGKITAQVAMVGKTNCGGCGAAVGTTQVGTTTLDVSILARGKGKGGRNLTPMKPEFVLNGEKFSPQTSDKFWIDKPADTRGVAIAAFAALGTQYERVAKQAVDNQGVPCSNDNPQAQNQSGRTGVGEAIDRAGMAAGLSLIASQSGQITGRKSCFDLSETVTQMLLEDGEAVVIGGMLIRTKVKNDISGKKTLLKIPVLGSLFRSNDQDDNETELIIQVTPQIINENE